MSSRTFSSGNVDVEFYFLESHRAFAFMSGLCHLLRHVRHICFSDVLYFMFSFLPYVAPWSGSQPCNMLSLRLMKRGPKTRCKTSLWIYGRKLFSFPLFESTK